MEERMPKKFKQLNVKLDTDLDRDLIEFLDNSMLKKSFIIKKALRSFIKQHQGLDDGVLSEKTSKIPVYEKIHEDRESYKEKTSLDPTDHNNNNKFKESTAADNSLKKRNLLFGKNEDNFMK
ncbi:hypothetical protein AALT52_01260 [Ligilactobacillus faecis]|uniref:Uncharacterized protein n=1 Tax=Ligilactobacillus faecis TaxID=762833 RepID=A0ABV4DQ11_9LACO